MTTIQNNGNAGTVDATKGGNGGKGPSAADIALQSQLLSELAKTIVQVQKTLEKIADAEKTEANAIINKSNAAGAAKANANKANAKNNAAGSIPGATAPSAAPAAAATAA